MLDGGLERSKPKRTMLSGVMSGLPSAFANALMLSSPPDRPVRCVMVIESKIALEPSAFVCAGRARSASPSMYRRPILIFGG